MAGQIIDGKAHAAAVRAEVADAARAFSASSGRQPGLAVVLVGDDPASRIYVNHKERACAEVGIASRTHALAAQTSETEVLDLIETLNRDPAVDGILVQLPLPDQVRSSKVIDAIDPHKDVDGFHPYNIGRLVQREPLLRPCTPYGVMHLIGTTGQSARGRRAVVVGASNIVGRPMGLELLLAGATVTTAHRFTRELAQIVAGAEIVVAAAGKPGLVKGEWIREGAIVLDVGITRQPNGKLAGDVEFEAALERAGWITPVPGGVGPMTVAMLLKNTVQAAETNLAAAGR